MAEANPELQSLLMLYQDQGAELRSRSQAEYLYTAAAIASFGAVAWGVASLQSNRSAALVAAVGVVIVGAVVMGKIQSDHTKYATAKSARAAIAKQLAAAVPAVATLIPEGVLKPEAGKGYIGSIAVILAAAVGAVLFCIAIACKH